MIYLYDVLMLLDGTIREMLRIPVFSVFLAGMLLVAVFGVFLTLKGSVGGRL